VATDRAGNVYIADAQHKSIRREDAATGIISTIAGDGRDGFCGDGGPATSACLEPRHLAVDAASNVFVADGIRVRLVEAATGLILTVAGNTAGDRCCDQCGPVPEDCLLADDLGIDPQGHLIFPETLSVVRQARVRRVTLSCPNGTLDPRESCDDGNLVSGDGCDTNCTLTGCGNGVLTAGEDCDDGNMDDDDACPATCQLNGFVPALRACSGIADLPACTGDRIPPGLARRVARACEHLGRAAVTATRALQLTWVAASDLRHAARYAASRGRMRGVSGSCTGALATRIRDAAESARAVLATL